MGDYEKKTFRPFWVAWYALAAADFFGRSLWGEHRALAAGFFILAAFVIVEAWAAYRKTLDDTLSEASAWLSGLASVLQHPYGSQMASALGAFLGLFAGWVVSRGWSSPVWDVVGAVIALTLWFWLKDHFEWLTAKILAKRAA